MRLDYLGPDYVEISVNETNLETLRMFGKVSLQGGSPRYPEFWVELVLQTNDDHLDARMRQYEEVRDEGE